MFITINSHLKVIMTFSDLFVLYSGIREKSTRLKSTLYGGPDYFLLCLSNFISLKVNVLGPILG